MVGTKTNVRDQLIKKYIRKDTNYESNLTFKQNCKCLLEVQVGKKNYWFKIQYINWGMVKKINTHIRNSYEIQIH